MAGPSQPAFLAREEGSDRMHHIPVVPGNGSDDYICELLHDPVETAYGNLEAGSRTMMDRASLEGYEFITLDGYDEVDTETVAERLKELA